MDDLLQAQGGEIAVTYQVDALGRVIAGGERLVEDTLGESQAGVVLTLDGELQRLAEEAAADLGQGAVVITQVPDCEILALASVPDFHPDRVGEAVDREDSPLVNRAFSAYAPGSVFKLVVAAALLEQGRPVESFPCTGSVNVNGLTFSCAGGQAHGEVDLEQALAQSCNGYFINAARSLGGQAILTMAYNLGLGEEVEFGRGLRGCRNFPAWKTPGPWGTSPSARGSSPPRPCSCAPWSTPWPRKACTPPPSSCWGRWRPTAGPRSCPLSRTGRCGP